MMECVPQADGNRHSGKSPALQRLGENPQALVNASCEGSLKTFDIMDWIWDSEAFKIFAVFTPYFSSVTNN